MVGSAPCCVLVGRQRQLDQLHRVLAAAAEGQGATVVLRGDAGMGKTALVDASSAAARASSTNWRVLKVTGVEAEHDIAHGGLITLLSPVQTLLGLVVPEHERVLRIATRLDAAVATIDPATLGVALLALFAALSCAGPLLVTVDDAQWLDRSSLVTIAFAARRIEHRAIAIVVATRAEAHQPVDLVAGFDDIDVGPLASTDVQLLALDHGLCPAAAASCWTITEGHPLALTELLRSLDDDHRRGRVPIDPALALASGLRHRYHQRVTQLPADTREALVFVALAGRSDVAFVARAITAGNLTMASLAAAEHADVIEIAAGAVRFRHPLLRAALLGTIDAATQRRAHVCLASACGTSVDVERKAWHLASAALGTDESLAAAMAAIARTSRQRGALAEAASAWIQAARLTDDEHLAGTYVDEAITDRWMGGDVDGTLALADDERGMDDLVLRARRASAVGQAMIWRGDTAAGIDHMRRAGLEVASIDPSLRARRWRSPARSPRSIMSSAPTR